MGRAATQASLGILLTLVLWGCGQGTARQEGKPTVVATSTILQDLTAQVAGDRITVQGILAPGEDPHIYEPVPRDTQQLETADLVLYNGYNLEPALIKLIQSTAGDRALAVGEVVPPLALAKGGSRVPDPHVWGSAENGALMVAAIRDRLVELVPADEAILTRNAQGAIAELAALHRWINQQTATIPAGQRQLVTTHDAFQYYAQAYGLTIHGTLIGISTEEQPSARTVKKLVNSLKSSQVPTIFAETTINPDLIRTVAQEAGVQLATQKLYSDSVGPQGSDAETYAKMLALNTRTLVVGLGGKVQEMQETGVPIPSGAIPGAAQSDGP